MPTVPKKHTRRPYIAYGIRKAQGRRKNPNYKFYNSKEWRQCAKAYESSNPICEQCEKAGNIVDATGRKGVTDHIRPINQGGAKFAPENLQRLCNRCHNKKSGSEAHLTNKHNKND